jgi:hypothetical protein
MGNVQNFQKRLFCGHLQAELTAPRGFEGDIRSIWQSSMTFGSQLGFRAATGAAQDVEVTSKIPDFGRFSMIVNIFTRI